MSSHVAGVRRFSRFYTRQLDLLNQGLLASRFSLTEARVLYELAHRSLPIARDLARDLALDAGYLSRILKRFERDGLLVRSTAPGDRRESALTLTEAGRQDFARLDRASHQQASRLLDGLGDEDRDALVGAMTEVERLLEGDPSSGETSFQIRGPEIGDLGWLIRQQGQLYAREYGWDQSFEVLVAEIATAFFQRHDPARERCWIAERDGVGVGSVFLVRASDTVGKLRLLYVDPDARGLGIGARLVDECVRFAREAGYETLTLWTNDILASARRIYQTVGFRLVAEERHHSFGRDLVGQNWELPLRIAGATSPAL